MESGGEQVREMVGIDRFEVAEGDFSEEAGAWGWRRDGEPYQFVIREGKEAWMEVEHWLVVGADQVEDVSFFMGGECDMLVEREVIQ